ncbi:MAG: SMC-Scp complex subunit ScpB [Candidatus Didemnitutus sp.]|nr:SMC-Scp complex subunit ScpB [Candidatus Didemnitutus sp.]
MAFNLKRVLKVLLFASNGALSAKDIQTTLTRFHEQAANLPLVNAPTPEDGTRRDEVQPTDAGVATPLPDATEVIEAGGEDAELYQDVPSLVTTAQIREAMETIALEWQAAESEVVLVEGHGGWRLVTHPRFARWVRLLRNEPPPVRLTPSAIETLAVISYRQPTTRAEIEQIRGVSAEAGLNKLLERDLIYVVGRADLPGRPLQYGTTDTFLEFVGIKSLDELPASDVLAPRQIDAWLNAANQPRVSSDAAMGLDETEPDQMTLDQTSAPALPEEAKTAE